MSVSSVKPKSARAILALSTVAAILVYTPVSQAFNFGNMMNPNRWFGGDRDRYDDRYDDPYWGGPYAPGPYGGYGYPGVYGAPYGLPYGVPGFGVPPAGHGTVPAQTPVPALSTQPKVDPSEVEALKRRIEELESRQQGPAQPPNPEWPTAPAFRPMNQY
ncbi:hypothetical protein [Allochromatium vinosum]|uniref:hypothetical protein n=1 Tax=Allochromatium vinosum TaxID=1049 RepID=UPI00190865AF|nr:hypothetical protein [Allochromatium vinosum]MBK1655084.1 hypothetical protein [Allochromatium vinosum]